MITTLTFKGQGNEVTFRHYDAPVPRLHEYVEVQVTKKKRIEGIVRSVRWTYTCQTNAGQSQIVMGPAVEIILQKP